MPSITRRTALAGSGTLVAAGFVAVMLFPTGSSASAPTLLVRPEARPLAAQVADAVPEATHDVVASEPASAPSMVEVATTQIEVAGTPTAQAVRIAAPARATTLSPLTSPDVGEHCADGLDAESLTSFFAEPIGDFQGADYQRATRLADDRVLWTFQDAFVAGRLVHNVGFVQSGRCFTKLGETGRSWLLADRTSTMQQWHWILDVAADADGERLHAFVVEMYETGSSYLSRTRPVALRRVVLDADDFTVLDVVDEAPTGDDLYGWSITSDGTYTYLYSHCYQQFGYDTQLGIGACAVDVKLARVPLGELDAAQEYWTGDGWAPDHTAAVPVVDGSFVVSGNNPAQIRFDGERYLLVEKRDDWWGATVEFGVADRPEGPFQPVASVDEPLKCDRSECNTYFASWIPWSDDGLPIWSIGHNRWNGAETSTHLDVYRPTFHTIAG